MATLTVNGRRVKVDDSFLSLPPEQQEATVNEIAASIGAAVPSGPEPIKLTGKVADLPSRRPTLGDEALSLGRGVIEGIPIAGPFLADARRGLDANIMAALHGGPAGDYQDQFKAADEDLRASTGGARTVGQIGGSIAALAPLGATAAGGRLLGMTGSLPSRLTMGGASGAALSGADTAARGGDADDIGMSMALGAGLGTVFPAIGGVKSALGAKAAQSKATTAAIKNAPGSAELKATASALFENSRAAGAGVEGNTFGSFAANLVQKAKNADIDPDLDGEAIAVYRRLAALAQEGITNGGVSLSRLHNLRQLAQDVAIDASKDRTKRFAGQIVDGLDDLIANLQPGQMTGQGGAQAANDLLEGIGTWARAKKISIVEEAIRKANLQKSGIENGLRLQFLAILRDPKKVKLFTKAEIAEMEKVAKGTAGNNILNLIGKFGFGLGNDSRNGLGGFLGGSAGFALGGPIGAGLAALVGSGARKGSEVLTEKAAERAAKVIATPNLPLLPKGAAGPALLPPALLPLEATRKREPLQITVRGGRPTS